MTDLTSKAIVVNQVTKRFGRTLALDNVNLEVTGGQVFALLGPNGAGKTTLIHILSTITRPDSGEAFLNGINLIRNPLKARQNLGVVFQEPSLDDRLTVVENLDFHGQVYGVPRAVRQKRIQQLLDVVELGPWKQSLVRKLSGGMKRRLEIARSLVHDARIVFLDEPTVGLDAQSRARVWDYIQELQSTREVTVVVTTHYIEEVEHCDDVCIIDDGSILAQSSPAELKRKYGQEILRVTAIDVVTADEMSITYQDRLIHRNGDMKLVFVSSRRDEASSEFMADFLKRFGDRIMELQLESPTLESVFLRLTGKELRDRAATGREVTYSFGRRGGEHTR